MRAQSRTDYARSLPVLTPHARHTIEYVRTRKASSARASLVLTFDATERPRRRGSTANAGPHIGGTATSGSRTPTSQAPTSTTTRPRPYDSDLDLDHDDFRLRPPRSSRPTRRRDPRRHRSSGSRVVVPAGSGVRSLYREPHHDRAARPPGRRPSSSRGCSEPSDRLLLRVSDRHPPSLDPGQLADRPGRDSRGRSSGLEVLEGCRVYAPMYPQLTLHAITDTGRVTAADTLKAHTSGVAAAWTDYLAHYNDGRGVVVIGHSQGAALLIALLRFSGSTRPLSANSSSPRSSSAGTSPSRSARKSAAASRTSPLAGPSPRPAA